MYMLIKDLQRSVVDRYANKGLREDFERVFERVELPFRVAAVDCGFEAVVLFGRCLT